MIERTLFYWAKMYMRQLKRGYNYSELNKTITINILDFDYIKIDKFHSWYHLYENDFKFRLTDLVEIHFIELPKFKKIDKEYADKLHRWLEFLQNPKSKEVEEIMEYDDKIKEAMDILSYISGDEEVVKLAEMRQKAILDEISRLKGARKEGKQEGKQEGKEEERIEIAKNMKRLGIDNDTIIKATGLNEEQILKI